MSVVQSLNPKTSVRFSLLPVVGIALLLALFLMFAHPLKAAAAACAAQADTSRGQVSSNKIIIPSQGTYYVWSRMKSTVSGAKNSYVFDINNVTIATPPVSTSVACNVKVGTGTETAWTWVKVTVVLPATPTGSNTQMIMTGDSDGVELDRVIFTTDATCTPDDKQNYGENCATPTPPDTTSPTISITSPASGSSQNPGTVNLAATATDNVGVSKVEFYVDNTVVNTATTPTTGSSYTYAYNGAALTAGTHTIKAVAYDAAGNPPSTATTSITITTPPPVCGTTGPSAPGSLAQANVNYTSQTITWTASTAVAGCTLANYVVTRDGTQVGTPTTNSFADTGLSASKSYVYTVKAVDTKGNSSIVASITAPTKVDDQSPTQVTGGTASNITTASVTLNWSAATDLPNPGGLGVAGYNVYRQAGLTAPSGSGTPVNGTLITTTNFTDPTVAANTQYTYAIVAVDKRTPTPNPSAPSNGIQAKTAAVVVPTCTTRPSAPGTPTTTANTTTTITFSWTASIAGANCTLASYNIYRAGVLLANVPAGTTSYPDSNLKPGLGYVYQIEAVDTNANKTSGNSNTLATVPDTTKPAAPASATAVASSPTQVNLTWTAATDDIGVASYNIFRTNGTTTVTVANVLSSAPLAYSDPTVVANTDYAYQIEAVDTSGNKSATKVTATPSPVHTPTAVDSTAPSVPGGLTKGVVGSQGAAFTWAVSTDSGGSGVASYLVYINGLYYGTTTTPSFTTLCISPNVTYNFTIVAKDNAGNPSNASTALAITTTSGGLAGDFNCNKIVSNEDFGAILANWKKTGQLPNYGDVNGDGTVSNQDFGAILANWKKTI